MSRKPRAAKSKARRVGLVAGIAAGSLALLLAAAAVAATVATSRFAQSDLIAPNVTLGGLAVGGLTSAEAWAALSPVVQAAEQAEMQIAYPGGRLIRTRAELGVHYDVEAALQQALALGREPQWLQRLATQWRLRREPVQVPLPLRVEEGLVANVISGLAGQVNREPKDARVEVEGDAKLVKFPGQSGVKLQVAESVAHLLEALQDPHQVQAELVVEEWPPNISPEDLANLQMVLGSYSTPYRPRERDRTHNMRLAMGKVNGTVVKPGQTLSLNETIGRRTPQAGYRNAPIFRDGDVVDDLGGGICQVSSTIYNAVLLANMQVVQRSPHSRPVWYCPTGRDAALYWGQLDLRFKNTLKYPVLVLGEIRGNRLWAAVVGHAEDQYEVKLIVTDRSSIPAGTNERPDPNLEEGKRVVERESVTGARATLWREVYRDGKQIKRERLHRDYYPPVSRIVRVGAKPVAPAEPETVPATEPPAADSGSPPAGSGQPGPAPAPAVEP